MAKNQVVETVFLGDSITEQYILDDFYPNKNYVNRGIGGNFSLQVLERLASNVLILKPKRIILLIGTNDLFYAISPKTAALNIEEIISRIKAVLPTTEVIVESVYAINEKMNKEFNRTNKNINILNALLIDICTKTATMYIDTSSILNDKDGELIKDYTNDGLHLNRSGYTALTEFLKSKIENL